MAEGLFITFEGGEGSGKSTQIARLEARLKGQGIEVLRTREPGGSPRAEALRAEIVSGAPHRWSPLAETLLINAARDSHLRDTIRPALERGMIVLCDRFMDSTRAYQGSAGGVDPQLISFLEFHVVGGTRPKLTVILDLDPDAGLARAKATENRFEQKGREFHRRLRAAYRDIAKAEPGRCKIIDAAGTLEAVSAAIWNVVQPLLPPRPR
jgi:dTMP kinase